MFRRSIQGHGGPCDLSKIETDCHDALGETVVQLSTQPPAFFVLKTQQTRGKLMHRFFCFFHLCNVSKRTNQSLEFAHLVENRNYFTSRPDNFRGYCVAPADELVAHWLSRCDCLRTWPHFKWDFHAILAQGND